MGVSELARLHDSVPGRKEVDCCTRLTKHRIFFMSRAVKASIETVTGLYKLVKVKSWEDQRSGHCVKHYMCSLTLSSTTLSFPFHIREKRSVEELSKFAQKVQNGFCCGFETETQGV